MLQVEAVVLDGILYRADHLAAELVRARLGGEPFTNYRALGLVADGVLVGGVVWHSWTPWGCEISIATNTPRWCSRAALRRLFAFTFVHLGRTRATARIRAGDERTARILERLGCVREGIHARDYDGTQDSVSYGMTAERCRWMGATA